MDAEKMVDIRTIIGQRLKEAREELGLSQRKLGLLTGLSDKTISAYEKGRVLPPLEVLLRIAKQLSKPVSFFLGEDNPVERLSSRIMRLKNQIKRLDKEFQEALKILENCDDLINKSE